MNLIKWKFWGSIDTDYLNTYTCTYNEQIGTIQYTHVRTLQSASGGIELELENYKGPWRSFNCYMIVRFCCNEKT